MFIYDAFAQQVGATQIHAKGSQYHLRVYDLEPMPYGDLIEKVKKATSLPALRATPGDPDRIVKTVGLPWGGMALFVNVGCLQQLIDLADIDVMIAGETDNYGFRFCQEVGIDVIETSHEVSEEQGLQDFTCWLQQQLPDVPVDFHPTPCVWAVR